MIETERSEFRTVKQLFGPDAHLVEHAPTTGRPGDVQVWLGRGMIGSGRTFRVALADALAFTSGGAVRTAASMMDDMNRQPRPLPSGSFRAYQTALVRPDCSV